MRDGFERVFDLVEAALGREDGGLRAACKLRFGGEVGQAKLERLTLESYLRDILQRVCARRTRGNEERRGRGGLMGGVVGVCR